MSAIFGVVQFEGEVAHEPFARMAQAFVHRPRDSTPPGHAFAPSLSVYDALAGAARAQGVRA